MFVYLALLQQALQHAAPCLAGAWARASSFHHLRREWHFAAGLPDAGEALQQVLRFESLVHDLGRSSFEREGDQVVYAWRNDCASHPAAGALAESVFSGIQTCDSGWWARL